MQDKDKIEAAKIAAKKRTEAAKALLPAKLSAVVDESGNPVKIEPCRRTACKDLERRLKQKEENTLDERSKLAELCQTLSVRLAGLEEQYAESERTNKQLEARSQAMKDHIAQTNQHTEELRAEAEIVKKKNRIILNQIQTLELEVQRRTAEARQAQADMVKAMW